MQRTAASIVNPPFCHVPTGDCMPAGCLPAASCRAIDLGYIGNMAWVYYNKIPIYPIRGTPMMGNHIQQPSSPSLRLPHAVLLRPTMVGVPGSAEQTFCSELGRLR